MNLNDYLYSKPVITTGRITLRPLTPEDVPSLREWMPDKAIYKYWGKKPGKTDLNPELMFTAESKPSKSLHLGIICNADGKAVGEIWVYLVENDRMAKVAFRVAPAYQGMGYATEALGAAVRFCFEKAGLRRLWTDVDVRNVPSVKVLEKCGFRREGTVRDGKMVSSWCDYHLYGLLASDMDI